MSSGSGSCCPCCATCHGCLMPAVHSPSPRLIRRAYVLCICPNIICCLVCCNVGRNQLYYGKRVPVAFYGRQGVNLLAQMAVGECRWPWANAGGRRAALFGHVMPGCAPCPRCYGHESEATGLKLGPSCLNTGLHRQLLPGCAKNSRYFQEG